MAVRAPCRRRATAALLAAAATLAAAAAVAAGVNFDVGPGREECFYEDVHVGTNINGVFAVTHGSHLDIDVVVLQPGGRQVYTAVREGEGKFMIRADKDGTYKFCFSNKMSMMSHKTVKLALTTGDPLDLSKLAKKESMDNVERWIVSISHTVRMIEYVFCCPCSVPAPPPPSFFLRAPLFSLRVY